MSVSFLHRTACEVCETRESNVVFSRPFSDPAIWSFLDTYYQGRIKKEDVGEALFEIRACSECGFIWQAYILDEAGMKRLYDEWIGREESQEKKVQAPVAFFSAYARDMERIASLFSRKPGELSLLDYGMGWGYWCLMAKAFGYRVMGLELSEDRLAFAKSNGIPVLTNLQMAHPNQFDFINADQVFEHIPSPVAVLKDCVRILSPQGVVRIAVPDGSSMVAALEQPGFRVTKDALHPLEHINCFTRATLIYLAKQAGLEPITPPFFQGRKGKPWRHLPHFVYRRFFTTALYFQTSSV